MSDHSVTAPPRAPQRWFSCIDYGHGLKIELPFGTEADAVESALLHLQTGRSGIVKVGYYGFRSRVIVYSEAELAGSVGQGEG